jgi:hypothetical protein
MAEAAELTDLAINKYKPKSKRRRIRDTRTESLFLIIEPSGRKSFQMRFRVGGGRIGKLTLGRYAESEMPDDPVIGQPLTLAAARQLAAQVHRARALGRDPVAEHKAAKQRRRAVIIEAASNTFAACSQGIHSATREQKGPALEGAGALARIPAHLERTRRHPRWAGPALEP